MERDIRAGSRFLQARVLRVLVVGGIGFILQTVIFEYLGIYLKVLSPSTAVILGAEVGVLTSFFLNNRFSFGDLQHSTLPLGKRLIRFHIVVSGSLSIQWIFMFVTQHVTTNFLILHAAYVSGVVVGFITNYAGYRHWVWKHHESPI